MTLTEFLQILFPPTGKKQLTPAQEAIIRHPQGPAWVLAGPGTGKTEVLTVMVLRLLYVEGDPIQQDRVSPESIVLTTFTEKAARNLQDRISQYRTQIVAQVPHLADIDVSKLRVGTLHGLCNDLLQEFRAPTYQNVRLMDEFEQSMFIYEQSSIITNSNPTIDYPFWSHFDYMFKANEWQTTWRNRRTGGPALPGKWVGTAALMKLFNRIVEDRVSVAALRAAGGQWARLAGLYEEYVAKLQSEHRCDFAHLQLKFLSFLGTPLGQHFRDGGEGYPGIQWVLVDEYQDTNRVQEEVYLTLANRMPYNVVVVGDDDQAMYRFRGGSVECMVTFDQACQAFLDILPTSVFRYPLMGNFRSHPNIVEFCDQYITSFPSISLPGARVPGKTAMTPLSSISGTYTAVGILRAGRVADVARRFAETVRELVVNGIVHDPSQCCLLLRSTKESQNNALPYVTALRDSGLIPYNPRNKSFLEQEEVAGLLGALLAIVDPNARWVPVRPDTIPTFVAGCSAEYNRLAGSHPNLAQYVAYCHTRMAGKPGDYFNATLQEIIYYLLSLPPFSGWQGDPIRRIRLGRLTALFESYSSMPVPGRPNLSKGMLRASNANPGEVIDGWCRSFYHLFFGYLSKAGFNDEEDEDAICPLGMVPVMTMHQAKGLEFPFIFVGHANANWSVSDSHRLETELNAFPINPARAFALLPENTLAELDLIRQYYVAYSRAEWALIIMGTPSQLRQGRVPCGPTPSWLNSITLPL